MLGPRLQQSAHGVAKAVGQSPRVEVDFSTSPVPRPPKEKENTVPRSELLRLLKN